MNSGFSRTRGNEGIADCSWLRSSARTLRLNLSLSSFLLEHVFERVAGVLNVFAKELAGCSNITPLPTQLEHTVMLFIRSLYAVCQIQLQAGVALSAVVDVSNDGHEARLVCARVENGMKLLVEAAPSRDVFLATEFANILTQNGIGLGKIFLGEMRYRQFQDFRLEQCADGKQLANVIRREGRNDGAPVRDDCDQTFGVQLAEGFADGNSADLVLGGDRVLPKLGTLRNFAPDNLLAQFVRHGGGE